MTHRASARSPRTHRGHVRRGLVVATVAFFLGGVAAARPPLIAAAGATITVPAVTDATLLPPMVAVQVRDATNRPLPLHAGNAEGRDDLPVLAVLDTGASAHVLSHDTAARLGVRTDGGARWIETGLTGEHPLAVSTAYALAIDAGAPLVLPAQRLLVNDVEANAAAPLTVAAAIDIVGMPALEHTAVELRFANPLAPPAVAFLPSSRAPNATQWVPLAIVDFSRRRHPGNHGAPPTLAGNPVLRGVRVVRGGHTAQGDWLLDTGAAVTIVSTAAARALGLTEPAPLAAPVGGIAGAGRTLPGWHVDRIELPTTTGGVIAIGDAAVFAQDITTTSDDGTRTTLDGVIGSNLLAAFACVVIDAPHGRLGLDPPAAAKR